MSSSYAAFLLFTTRYPGLYDVNNMVFAKAKVRLPVVLTLGAKENFPLVVFVIFTPFVTPPYTITRGKLIVYRAPRPFSLRGGVGHRGWPYGFPEASVNALVSTARIFTN